MGRREMPGDLGGRQSPAAERLIRERREALVGARQVGQETVDPRPVETAHDFGGEVPELVALVEQRGEHQQAA